MTSISSGLKSDENSNYSFELQGPAGLFKSIEKHPFCWGLLNECNRNMSACPINSITFHRKGLFGTAKEVVDESKTLLNTIFENYPNLRNMPFSNRYQSEIFYLFYFN